MNFLKYLPTDIYLFLNLFFSILLYFLIYLGIWFFTIINHKFFYIQSSLIRNWLNIYEYNWDIVGTTTTVCWWLKCAKHEDPWLQSEREDIDEKWNTILEIIFLHLCTFTIHRFIGLNQINLIVYCYIINYYYSHDIEKLYQHFIWYVAYYSLKSPYYFKDCLCKIICITYFSHSWENLNDFI